MKLSIIIPVYNEKDTILNILEKVNNLSIEKEIIVVDDCSNDGTREILKLKGGDSKILYQDKNQGKGSAVRAGLKVAKGDYVVVQDADLEYDPRDLETMFLYMQKKGLRVLYGSRRLNKNNVQYSGLSYYLGGYLLTWVANILYGQNLTDEPTCYKMFKIDFIKNLPLKCKGFEFCPEVTALSALQDEKIEEIAISYYPRTKKQGKKISWQDALVAIWVLFKYRFKL